jgi:anti-anti-sigma factor
MSISSKINSEGTEITISVVGRFDFNLHQKFRSVLGQASGRILTFTVDLQQSDYMDSAALGMLLLLLDKVGGHKDRVKIINPNQTIRKILEIANFDKLFTIGS